MQLSHKPTKILITGKSGSGKSTYFTRFILGHKCHYRFIFDNDGEFAERTGYPNAFTPADMAEHLSARRLVVFNPNRMFAGDKPRGFLFFCEWVCQTCRRMDGKKLFACDELQHFTGTNIFPMELALVVDTGRRSGIDCVFVSQRPNRIHNSICDCLSECVAFAHRHERAMEFLEDWGFDGDEIRGLRPGEFIALNDEGTLHRGRVF